jgi:hypothetical protein
MLTIALALLGPAVYPISPCLSFVRVLSSTSRRERDIMAAKALPEEQLGHLLSGLGNHEAKALLLA